MEKLQVILNERFPEIDFNKEKIFGRCWRK